MNWPESLLSFTSANACTIFGWPQTKPSRQPIMLKPFDIEWTSTPTSFAPGTCEEAQRRARRSVSRMWAASCTTTIWCSCAKSITRL